MRRERRSQRDLFERTPPSELRPGVRTTLTPLLQALLTEAAGEERQLEADDQNSGEDADDQDHA